MVNILPLNNAPETPVPRLEFNVRPDGTLVSPISETPISALSGVEAPVEEAPVEEAPVEEAPVEEAPVEEFTFNIPESTLSYEDSLTLGANLGAPEYAKLVVKRYNTENETNLSYEELLKESGGDDQALVDKFIVPYPQKISISIKALQDVAKDDIPRLVYDALPDRRPDSPGGSYEHLLKTNYDLYQQSPDELMRRLNPEEAFIHRYVKDIRDLKSAPSQLAQSVAENLARLGPSFAAASGLGYAGAAVAGAVGLPVAATVVGLGAIGYGIAEMVGAGDYLKEFVQEEFYGGTDQGQRLPSGEVIEKVGEAAAEGLGALTTGGGALVIRRASKEALKRGERPLQRLAAAEVTLQAQAARNASTLYKIPYIGAGAARLRKADDAVANYFSGVGETMIGAPGTAAVFEGTGIVASSAGAGFAESVDPGAIGTSIGSQIVAPMLIPGRVILNVGAGLVKKAQGIGSGSAAESAAAQDMLEILRGFLTEQNKGNLSPEELQSLLEDTINGLIAKYESPGMTLADLAPGLQQTAAEVAAGAPGAEVIAALTREFIKRGGSGEALSNKLEANMKLISELADSLFNTGDPALLGIAASLRREAYSSLIQGQIDDNARKVTEAAEAVIRQGKGVEIDVVAESAKMQELLEDSLKFARKQEEILYKALDGTQEFNAKATIDALDKIMGTATAANTPPRDILAWAWSSFSNRPVPAELLEVYKPLLAARTSAESARKRLRNAIEETPELTSKFDVLEDTFDDLDTLKAYSDDLLKPVKEREIVTDDFMQDIFGRSMSGKEEGALKAAVTAKQRLIKQGTILASIEKTLEAGVDVAGGLKAYIPANLAREEAALTLDQLMAQRSIFLKKGRDLAKNGDSDSRYYFQVAEAIAEDIGRRAGSVSEKAATTGVPLTEAEKGLITANEFTLALHETFVRSYVNKATGKLPPEGVIDSVFAGNTNLVSKRIQDIIDASRFIVDGQFAAAGGRINIPENLVLEGPPPASTISDALNNVLKAAIDPANKKLNILDAVIDAKGGITYTISPQKLAQFRKSYEGVLKDYFPDLYEDLASAETASRFFNLSEGVVDPNIVEKLTKGNRFFDFIGVENPSVVMGKIFARNNPSPEKDLNKIITGIRDPKSLPPGTTVKELEEGLVEAMVQRAWVEASSDAGFNFKKFSSILKRPLSSGSEKGGSSALNILRQRGVLSDTRWAQLNILLRQGEVIEQALKSGVEGLSVAQKKQIRKSGGLLRRFLGKMAGSRLGTFVGSVGQRFGGRAPGLIEAGAGIEVVQTVLDKIPQAMLKNVLFDALNEPELMQALLKETLTAQEGIKISKFLRSYYASWLVGPGGEEEDPSIERKINQQIFEATIKSMNPGSNPLSQRTPPPVVPPPAVVVPPTPPITPPLPQQGAALDLSGPFNPETYARLFPNEGVA